MSGEHRILVAVDFSECSKAALVWALDLARRLGARVEVHHVVHDPAGAPGAYQGGDGERLQPFEVKARAMMDDFLAEVAAQHPDLGADRAHSSLSVGLPPTRILEVAEQIGARQIVVGSRGRTGLAHLLLGSKAERIAQLSPIPVTIVKAAPGDETDAQG